ncbi:MAG TPA: DUF4157 domain-containing protein [Pyrinomonadaceae bacterium]|nr:DUF4157 domain-containing protein [Pyrinomonadaceae bacterium]
MSTQKQEKTVDTQRQPATEEPALEASTWLAPFNPGTFLSLQNTIGNRAVSQLLQADSTHLGHNGNGHRLNHAAKSIQKKQQEGAAERTPEPEAPARTLIVEDDANDVQPGQMRKTEFLDRLKTSVCGAAEEVLRNTMWSAMGCPYIERWFSHYGAQSSQHVERALRRYAPETARATTAEAYIPIVTERIRRGLSQWAETGEMTGVPEEFRQGEMPGVTLQGLVSTALTGIGRAIGSAASAVGSAASSVGRALLKAREGGEKDVGDPEAIRGQLGHGHSLDGKTRQRMENAFGVSFSGVRVHTGAQAENLSQNMNARAFTVGNDIAFGPGEYSPGTLVGDALIAHELAHTVQQGNGSSAQVASRGDHSHGVLEEQADVAAVHAVASAWGLKSAAGTQAGRLTQLRSGLKLQRCGARQQAQTRSLADFQSMTAFQLSRVSDAEFDRAASSAQSSGGPTIADYRRASQFARAVFNGFHINFDIDTYTEPLGQEPTDAQLAVLDRILEQILSMDGGAVRGIVSGPGGRRGLGLPTAPGSRTASLRGRVRYWPRRDVQSRGQFAAKVYRLGKISGDPPTGVEEGLAELEGSFGVRPPAGARFTRQEIDVAVFLNAGNFAAGFYFPAEDRFYLEPGSDISEPGAQSTARHEMAHMLGGSSQTQEAFRQRYGANYQRLWRPFEEGMAEFVRTETQTPQEGAAVAAGQTTTRGSVTTTREQDPFYVASLEWIRRLVAAAPGNRPLLLNAYFTGTISNEVFQLIESTPPPGR